MQNSTPRRTAGPSRAKRWAAGVAAAVALTAATTAPALAATTYYVKCREADGFVHTTYTEDRETMLDAVDGCVNRYGTATAGTVEGSP